MTTPSVAETPQQRFDSLADSYYRSWFRFHPEIAVDLGVPGHEAYLTPYDDDDIGALIALHEKMLAGLEEINADELDPDRRIDHRLMTGQATIEHHELLERDWRRRAPGCFVPVNAIYQLTVREVPDMAGALCARLERIPDYLRGARSHLQQMPELIPVLWLESACREACEGAVFLRDLGPLPTRQVAPHRRARIHELAEGAAHALEDFSRFLEQELGPYAAGDYGCGRDHFERLLSHRHFLDLDADALHDFGRRLFADVSGDLEALLQEAGAASLEEVLGRIQADHPSPTRLLDCYREQMEAARGFVQQRQLVSLPVSESLIVVETPAFLRHQIPFAAYHEPAPADEKQRGLYYVTPATEPAMLAEHNFRGLKHTCVHEAWPGHHLQFVTANRGRASRSLARLTNPSSTLYEGWALYCEQLMVEEGFLQGIEHRILLLRDRLWRALRVMLDVELHTRALDVDSAADRMQEALGFPREQALADLNWYTRSPAVPMGYAVGWALINEARTALCEQGPCLAVREFHDRLLSPGSMALGLVIQRAFGADVWETAQRRLVN